MPLISTQYQITIFQHEWYCAIVMEYLTKNIEAGLKNADLLKSLRYLF